jgi:hypothetical protein
MADNTIDEHRGERENTGQSTKEDLANQASEMAGTAAETAREAASEAHERINITLEDQKKAGAHRIAQFADAAQTAAAQLEKDTPEFAHYIRGAAEQVRTLSDTLKEKNVGDLFTQFQSFARQHPTAFLGATVLTGFALARFLKSSVDANDGSAASRTASSRAGSSDH